MQEKSRWYKIWRKVKMLIIILLGIFLIWLFLQKPSHDREWEVGQEKLPHIKISNSLITVDNFRNFTWKKMGMWIKNTKP